MHNNLHAYMPFGCGKSGLDLIQRKAMGDIVLSADHTMSQEIEGQPMLAGHTAM
jgi:hypothetical protein